MLVPWCSVSTLGLASQGTEKGESRPGRRSKGRIGNGGSHPTASPVISAQDSRYLVTWETPEPPTGGSLSTCFPVCPGEASVPLCRQWGCGGLKRRSQADRQGGCGCQRPSLSLPQGWCDTLCFPSSPAVALTLSLAVACPGPVLDTPCGVSSNDSTHQIVSLIGLYPLGKAFCWINGEVVLLGSAQQRCVLMRASLRATPHWALHWSPKGPKLGRSCTQNTIGFYVIIYES